MRGIGNLGRNVMALALAGVLLWTAGCDILDEGEPGSARVLIEGGGGESFTLVTSNNFTVFANEEGETTDVILVEGDSIVISAPFNEKFSLGSARRFYLKAFRETGLSEPINIRVNVGGEERYNSTSTLEDLTLEFVYTIR